jgi:hypothetical protein
MTADEVLALGSKWIEARNAFYFRGGSEAEVHVRFEAEASARSVFIDAVRQLAAERDAWHARVTELEAQR